MKDYATYIRVSTTKQGRSGLGLDAQRKMCADFIERNNGKQVCEFLDVESGTHRDRKGLRQAITYCKQNGCPLVIAKLDRLARDVEFCFRVVNTGIEIHFCDFPTMNTLLLGVFASVAQYERELTSDRTKKALAVKKQQGCKLGAANEKYRENYAKLTEKIKKERIYKMASTKNTRKLENRDTQALIKALRQTFNMDDDVNGWQWEKVTMRGDNSKRIMQAMRDFKEMDDTGRTFARWDFTDMDDNRLYHRVAAAIQTLRRSIMYQINN